MTPFDLSPNPPTSPPASAIDVAPVEAPVCCGTSGPARAPVGRSKLWQLDNRYHCLVLGTCLDVGEVRALATKSGFEHDELEDYEIHHACVHAAKDRQHPMTRAIQKRLEEKYARDIRLFARERDTAGRRALWEKRREEGDIGGALWALATQAGRDLDLLDTVYGQVHMLQHGTCAREAKLRRRVARYRQQLETLGAEHEDDRERLVAQLDAARERTRSRERELADCRAELAAARATALAAERGASAARERPDRVRTDDPSADADRAAGHGAPDLPARLDAARTTVARQTALIDKLRSRAARHRAERARDAERHAALQADASRLERLVERLLGREAAGDPDAVPAAPGERPTLCGRCVLVIGGQANQCRHYRALVEASEGVFLHHDGGVEDKPARVAELVRRADAVLCPTEQVSHDAMRRAKRLCRAEDKPMIYMQRASLAAFADSLEQLSRSPVPTR